MPLQGAAVDADVVGNAIDAERPVAIVPDEFERLVHDRVFGRVEARPDVPALRIFQRDRKNLQAAGREKEGTLLRGRAPEPFPSRDKMAAILQRPQQGPPGENSLGAQAKQEIAA